MISDSTIKDGPGGSRRAGSRHLPIAAQPKGEDWLSDSAEEGLAHLSSSATGRGSSVKRTMDIPSVGGMVASVFVTIYRTLPILRGREVVMETSPKATECKNGIGSHTGPASEALGS